MKVLLFFLRFILKRIANELGDLIVLVDRDLVVEASPLPATLDRSHHLPAFY
jgi:hypothetical protein